MAPPTESPATSTATSTAPVSRPTVPSPALLATDTPVVATDTPAVAQVAASPTLSPLPSPSVAPDDTATCTPSYSTPTATPSQTATASPTPWACVVQADLLNLRAGPGMTYEVIGRLAHGELLRPEGRDTAAGWLQVRTAAHQQGWVSGRLVSCDDGVETLAVVTPPPSPPPPSPTPTSALSPPTATLAPPSAPLSAAHQYLPAGPARADASQPCPGCPLASAYIHGQVRDAGGNPLPGVRLLCSNDWHRYPVAASKGDGWYDFPVIQDSTVWYVVVVDESDQPISPVAAVQFDVSVACWYRLDWQRAF